MPRSAVIPPKLAPYPILVGTAITGALTIPATTLGSAPSIPATTINTRAARSVSCAARRRCTPATPADALGLLKSAIRDDDPVVFIEGELLYNVKGEVPDDEHLVPIGLADIKRVGEDVTIVTHSKMVHVAMQAAEKLAAEHEVEAEAATALGDADQRGEHDAEDRVARGGRGIAEHWDEAARDRQPDWQRIDREHPHSHHPAANVRLRRAKQHQRERAGRPHGGQDRIRRRRLRRPADRAQPGSHHQDIGNAVQSFVGNDRDALRYGG